MSLLCKISHRSQSSERKYQKNQFKKEPDSAPVGFLAGLCLLIETTSRYDEIDKESADKKEERP